MKYFHWLVVVIAMLCGATVGYVFLQSQIDSRQTSIVTKDAVISVQYKLINRQGEEIRLLQRIVTTQKKAVRGINEIQYTLNKPKPLPKVITKTIVHTVHHTVNHTVIKLVPVVYPAATQHR